MMPSNLPLTVVDCGTLTNPVNGQVNYTAGTTFGQDATYSCNTGYILVGSNARLCQATELWSGSPPICQSMFIIPCMHTVVEILLTSLCLIRMKVTQFFNLATYFVLLTCILVQIHD